MPDQREHDQDDTRRPYKFGRGEHRPVKLAIAALLIATLGLGALAWGGTWFVTAITGGATDEQASVMGSVLIALVGALLIRCAVALWMVDAWARVPAIVFSLICVPIAYQLAFKADLAWIGVPILAGAIAIISLLFSEDVRLAYNREV